MRTVRSLRTLVPALAAPAVLTLALLTLAGCGGDPAVDRAGLEKSIASQLAKKPGSEPLDVSCPGDLAGTVGTTMRCSVSSDGRDVPIEVQVTSVDGSDVNFRIAPTLLRSSVEEQVSSSLARQVGQTPDDISCPDDLVGRVGVKMRCTLTAGSDQLGVTVTVTSVEGKTVNFDIEVDDQLASPSPS